MGQFDTETDAALSQLGWEGLEETPGAEFAEIASELLALIGTTNPFAIAGKASSLFLKVRKLAGASYASNLVYVFKAVRNDLKSLYEICESFRAKLDSLPSDPDFAKAISALALRAMHTSAKNRLKRLARLVVNGVRDNDLEPESLDDLLRAGSELTESDIDVLRTVSEAQTLEASKQIYSMSTSDGTINFPRELWQTLKHQRFISPENQLIIRSSLMRLQSLGFGTEIQTMESS
jgi:hypothetical protein